MTRDALAATLGLGVRAVAQALSLWIVSGWLGAENYGEFVVIFAIVALALPFSGWGVNTVVSRDVSLGGIAAKHALNHGSSQILASLPPLLVLVLLTAMVSGMETGVIPWVVLLFFVEAGVGIWAGMVSGYLTATSRAWIGATVITLIPLVRVALLLVISWSESAPSPEAVIATYGVASLIGIGFLLAICVWAGIDISPRWERSPSRMLRTGALPALIAWSMVTYQEIDKVILSHWMTDMQLGEYGLAFRMATLATLPFIAAPSVLLARWSQSNSHMRTSEFWAVLSIAFGVGSCGVVALLLLAPAIPLVFGSEFGMSGTLLAWLAPWPVLFGCRQVLIVAIMARSNDAQALGVHFLGIGVAITVASAGWQLFGMLTGVVAILMAEMIMLLAAGSVMLARRRPFEPSN